MFTYYLWVTLPLTLITFDRVFIKILGEISEDWISVLVRTDRPVLLVYGVRLGWICIHN